MVDKNGQATKTIGEIMPKLTITQAVAHLASTGRARSPQTIKRWIHRECNPLPATRRGRGTQGKGAAWLIEQDDLDAFVLPKPGPEPRGA